MHVIQAYLLSKGTFQCSTWPGLSVSQYSRFHGCIMGMYRDAAGKYYVPGSCNRLFNDDDVIYEHSLVCPMTLLRSARLQLFVRVLRKSPPAVVQLAAHTHGYKHSWSASIHQDLQWLAASDKFLQCAAFSFDEWVNFLSVSPGLHGKCIKRCCICTSWHVVPHASRGSFEIQLGRGSANGKA